MAARKAAVLDELDVTGAFGSGARSVSLNRAARPATLSREAEARILGTTKATTGQSEFQKADQNRFDRSFGFTETHTDISRAREAEILNPKKAPTSVPITPALRTQVAPTNPLNGLTALPVDPFRGITSASRPPMLNTDITRPGPVFPAPAPVAKVAPVAPAPTPNATPNIANAWATNNVSRTAQPMAGYGNLPVPGQSFPNMVTSFARRAWEGLTTPMGGTTAAMQPRPARTAGVTNATAAQFQVPTKENPLPVTQTTPETQIDRSENSLAKFGLSEDEQTKRKRLFAGF